MFCIHYYHYCHIAVENGFLDVVEKPLEERADMSVFIFAIIVFIIIFIYYKKLLLSL